DRPAPGFRGPVPRYQKYVRNGRAYYQLATTGGGSRMRGLRYGEFDHLVWVTMKKSGPVLANILLDGIYPENMRLPETSEPAVPDRRKPTHPVRGQGYFEGTPAGKGPGGVFPQDPGAKKQARAGGRGAAGG